MLTRCPICNGKPYFEQVEPWPADLGPAPWAVGCYRTIPVEHWVGVNGDTEGEASSNWEVEVVKIRQLAES